MTALVISLICLALNAFFVAAEFALVKVRAAQIAPRARRGDRRAIAAELVLGRLDRYLSVTQLGITVASLGLGWVAEPALEQLGDDVALAVRGQPLGTAGHVVVGAAGLAVLTYFHLLLGELVPKFIAIQRAEATVLFTAVPLRLVNIALRPLLVVFERSQEAVLRLFGMHTVHSEGELSEDEILGLLAARAAHSAGARETQRLVEGIVRLGRRPVRNVMVPRVDMFAVPVTTPGDRAYDLLVHAGFSRIPLTSGGSPDEIVGYLYAKDFLLDRHAQSAPSLDPFVRRALFVPESRDALAVLRDMQRERTPLAVVIDEYGGTSGIVTLEDLVEQVFGEIRDELDIEPPQVQLVEAHADGKSWDVDASATTDLLRELGIAIDEEEMGEPLAHLVMRRLGHLPRIGEVVALAPGVEAEVREASRRRVERVRVRTTSSACGTGDA